MTQTPNPSDPGQPTGGSRLAGLPRKWKIIGGVVIAVIVLAIIGRCTGGAPTTTPGVSPTPTAPTSAAPSSAPPSSAPASSEPAEPEQDPQEWAEEVGDDLLQAVRPGAESFQDACPDNEWVCPIAKVHANVVGQLHVVEQVDGLDEATAEDWATKIFNMVGEDHPELDWVIIEDGTEVVVGQVQRSDVPLLN